MREAATIETEWHLGVVGSPVKILISIISHDAELLARLDPDWLSIDPPLQLDKDWNGLQNAQYKHPNTL